MAELEAIIAATVERAVADALAPYLRRLTDPECLTYSVPQAAKVIGVSEPTVRRAIDEGHLPLVPHMGERRLIPRSAVDALLHGSPCRVIGCPNRTTSPQGICGTHLADTELEQLPVRPLHLVDGSPPSVADAPTGPPPATGRGTPRTA